SVKSPRDLAMTAVRSYEVETRLAGARVEEVSRRRLNGYEFQNKESVGHKQAKRRAGARHGLAKDSGGGEASGAGTAGHQWPASNGRLKETSRVNPAEERRDLRLSCVFSTVSRACLCRSAIDGRPEPLRLFHPSPNSCQTRTPDQANEWRGERPRAWGLRPDA